MNLSLSRSCSGIGKVAAAADDVDDDAETTSTTLPPKVDNDIGKHSDASKTDDEVVQK